MGNIKEDLVNKNVTALTAGIMSRSATGGQLYSPEAITVLPELEEFMAPQLDEDIKELENDILKYRKIRDKLLVWQQGEQLILVDGHTRLRIAKKHSLKFEIERIPFKDVEQVKVWMVKNQRDIRRNLTTTESAYYIGWEYQNELKKAYPDGKIYHEPQVSENEANTSAAPKVTISQRIAMNHRRVTEKTVRIYGYVFLALDWLRGKNPSLFVSISKETTPVNLGVLERIGLRVKGESIDIPVEDIRQFIALANKPEVKKAPLKAPKAMKQLVSKLSAHYKVRSQKSKEEALKYLMQLYEQIKAEDVNTK